MSILRAILITILCALCFPDSACADEVGQLKQELNALRSENRLLEQKMTKQEKLITVLSQRVEQLEIKGTGALPAPPPETSVEPSLPKMELLGFGDVAAEARSNRRDMDSTFWLGELDFMVSSRLTERFDVFNETVIEFMEDKVELDVERLYLKYRFSEWFSVAAGRFHMPSSYWNDRYHHGTWFQTSATRPLLVEYEHTSGILPMHLVGIDFSGTKQFESLTFRYHFDIVNGRDARRTEVQNSRDKNDAKALNLMLAVEPQTIPGLKVGASGYLDKIPPLASVPERDGEIKELILGGFLAYDHKNWEALAEGYYIQHRDGVSNDNFGTSGFYSQVGYRIHPQWLPYSRFEFLNFAQGDPYYSGIDTDTQRYAFGLRWDVAQWNALKLEYDFENKRRTVNEHVITVKDAFHF